MSTERNGLINPEKMFKGWAEELNTDLEVVSAILRRKLAGVPETKAAEIILEWKKMKVNPVGRDVYIWVKGNNVVSGVTVDGGYSCARKHGITMIDTEYTTMEDGDIACRAVVKRGDEFYSRTEFLSENRGNGPIWKKWGKRMLGHRAVMSTLRAAGVMTGPPADELQEAGFDQIGESTTPPAQKSPIKFTGTGDMQVTPGDGKGEIDDPAAD